MKAFQGKKQYSSSRGEYLDACISVFETLAKMCDVTQSQKQTSMPNMLTGDSLSYYACNVANCDIYDQSIELL